MMFVFIYMYIYRPPENKRINMSDKIIERMNTSYAQLSTHNRKRLYRAKEIDNQKTAYPPCHSLRNMRNNLP